MRLLLEGALLCTCVCFNASSKQGQQQGCSNFSIVCSVLTLMCCLQVGGFTGAAIANTVSRVLLFVIMLGALF